MLSKPSFKCSSKQNSRSFSTVSFERKTKVGHGYWSSLENQIRFLNHIGKKLGVSSHHDWYKVSIEQLKDAGGGGLISKYKNSMYTLLTTTFPQFDWNPWMFKKVPRSFWDFMENQTKFLNWFSEEMMISSLEDWYYVTYQQLVEKGGYGLLKKYNSSTYTMLKHFYPDYDWKPWLFKKAPQKFWQDTNNQKKFLQWLAEEFDVHSVEDWQRITVSRMIENKAMGILKRHGNSVLRMFSTVFPEQDWNAAFGQLHTPRQKSQKLLEKVVREIFPYDQVLIRFRHPDLKFEKSGKNMELDIFLPDKLLAFEYQGEHHYQPVQYSDQPLSVFQSRDEEKRAAARVLGVTLVEVPYWWDRSKNSLVATIAKIRPDLNLKVVGEPIPSAPKEDPRKFQGIGLLLARNYNSKVDPTGWWMSEKFDGIRAYWSGSRLLSRGLLPLPNVPDDIIRYLPPNIALDGELWFGYGTLPQSMKIVFKAKNIPWKDLKFHVFDAPLCPGPYEKRLEYLKSVIPANHSFLQVVDVTKCTGKPHMKKFLEQVLERGGEGVMLRAPMSPYASGRSSTLLKLKPYKDDEAVIVGVPPDAQSDRYECKLSSGIVFPASLKASRITEPVKIGDVVTFQHGGYYQNGRPRTPWILHSRPEISAENYLINHYSYYLGKGKTQGECHTCRKPLLPNKLRIGTDKARASTGQLGMFYMMHVEFCPSLDCVRMRSPSLMLPQFKYHVIVLEHAKEVEEEQQGKGQEDGTPKNQFGMEAVDVKSEDYQQLIKTQQDIHWLEPKKFVSM